MSTSILQNKVQNNSGRVIKPSVCNRCGGSGYTKSSPDCYKTCLYCLGKGLFYCKNNTL